MSKRTFAARTFASWTFRPWALAGPGGGVAPSGGWIAQAQKYFCVAENTKRIMTAQRNERVWVAK